MDGGDEPIAEFARDVREFMCAPSGKSLPAKHLYDAVGTALFEAITHLPDYGLTRADNRLLKRLAPSLPSHFRADGLVVAELGSGSGLKARVVLEALTANRVLAYCPIDVSAEALRLSQREFNGAFRIRGHNGSYVEGLEALKESRPPGTPLLVLFMGSSIGNFAADERTELLADLRRNLRQGDCMLIGFDLEKDRDMLVKAYDDPTGVTAAFNRNVLGRVNRELGGTFDLNSFRHIALYNEQHRRVEMHLRSASDQSVAIPLAGATCELSAGETIWTESSYKFRPAQIRQIMASAGFRQLDEWTDTEWGFLEGLWAADG